MDAPPPKARAVSILGHPVAGLAPVTLLSVGWVLLATQLLPRLSDFLDDATRRGLSPSLTGLWPLNPQLLMFGLLVVGLLLFGLIFFLVWVRSAGGLGPLSDRILTRSGILAGCVLIASAVLTSALVSPGTPVGEFVRDHVARGTLWHESLRAGAYPIWTDLWYGGSPGVQHVPALPHLLEGLIGFFRVDPFTAAKHLAWFCRITGAIGFALLVGRIHRDNRSGLLGGLLYALAPAFHAAWIWDGQLGELLTLALLPWVLFAGERLATGVGGYRTGARLALGFGLIAMSWIGQVRWLLILVGIFMLLRAVPTVATRGARAPSIPGILIGILGTAGLILGFLIPLMQDAGSLIVPRFAPLGSISLRPPPIGEISGMFVHSIEGYHYLGLSIGILAIGGLLLSILDRREGSRAIGPIPLISMIVLPWCLTTKGSESQVLLFLGVMMAAAGVVRRPPKPSFRSIPRKGLYPIVILLVLIDLAPISLTTRYDRMENDRERMHAMLEERVGSGRFLELTVGDDRHPSASIRNCAAGRMVASVGGPSTRPVLHTFAYQMALIDTLDRCYAHRDTLNQGLVDLLAFHNVSYLVFSSREGPQPPRESALRTVAVDPEVPGIRIEDASPVWILEPGGPQAPAVVATELAARPLPRAKRQEIAKMQIDWLLSADPTPVEEARAVVLPNRLEIELPDLGSVELRVARIPYPNTKVQLDGNPWPWREGPLGGISLLVEPGPHRIRIEATEDPLHRGVRIGQWALAGLLFLVAIGPRRR